MNKRMATLSGWLIVLILAAPSAEAVSIRIGASLGYYALSDSLIKSIYKSGGPHFGGFLALGLNPRLELRIDAGSFKVQGKMTLSEELLTFSEIPITAGLRYQFLNKKLSPYVGAGGGYLKYEEKYPERFTDVSDSGVRLLRRRRSLYVCGA